MCWVDLSPHILRSLLGSHLDPSNKNEDQRAITYTYGDLDI